MWRKKLTSSGGLNDGSMCPTADGNVRCEWDSTRPGMTVAPVQSTTWSPGSASVPPPARTLSMRSPRTTTSAGTAGAPVPSKTCPLTNRMRFTPKVNVPAVARGNVLSVQWHTPRPAPPGWEDWGRER